MTSPRYDPATVIARLQQLAQELHDGELGPSSTEWEQWAGAEYPRYNWLKKNIGNGRTWASVLQACGLNDASKGERWQLTVQKREALARQTKMPRIARSLQARRFERAGLPSTGWQRRIHWRWDLRAWVETDVAVLR